MNADIIICTVCNEKEVICHPHSDIMLADQCSAFGGPGNHNLKRGECEFCDSVPENQYCDPNICNDCSITTKPKIIPTRDCEQCAVKYVPSVSENEQRRPKPLSQQQKRTQDIKNKRKQVIKTFAKLVTEVAQVVWLQGGLVPNPDYTPPENSAGFAILEDIGKSFDSLFDMIN